jgi:hypothetical protein
LVEGAIMGFKQGIPIKDFGQHVPSRVAQNDLYGAVLGGSTVDIQSVL